MLNSPKNPHTASCFYRKHDNSTPILIFMYNHTEPKCQPDNVTPNLAPSSDIISRVNLVLVLQHYAHNEEHSDLTLYLTSALCSPLLHVQQLRENKPCPPHVSTIYRNIENLELSNYTLLASAGVAVSRFWCETMTTPPPHITGSSITSWGQGIIYRWTERCNRNLENLSSVL